jgi:hypothetical protein
LVEEAGALTFDSSTSKPNATGETALAFLDQPATGDLASVARNRIVNQAHNRVTNALGPAITEYAQNRARELNQDHARVRDAGAGVARVSVEPVLPPDIIGLYVLLPQGR